MQLNITFRHMDSSDSLKEYAQDKVDRVHKYLDRVGDAHVVLSLERHLHHADITVHSGAFVLRGREKSEDMYASIDLAMDKIERQLRRYKERLKNHHGREFEHHQMKALNHMRVRHDVVSVHEDSDEKIRPEARVVKTNDFLAKPMSVDEAVMQMDLMNNDFLVFTNSKSQQMNVLYRRKDGHYGLIEASQQAAALQKSA